MSPRIPDPAAAARATAPRTGSRTGSRTGERIRARRLERGIKQADLARACGISASYLNLIEHDRRSIGGALLTQIARALDAEPGALSRGVEAGLLAALREAAEGSGAPPRAPDPEIEDAEVFALRHPGWAALVVGQARRLREAERTVSALADRLSHDARLAGALHEVLSAATAIRSAASILTEPGEVAPGWRQRFLRNIAEDSLRLSQGAEALSGSLGEGRGPDAPAPAGSPREEMEAWIDARPGLAAALARSPEGDATLPATLAAMGEPPPAPAARALLEGWLARLARDQRALPEARLAASLAAVGPSPDLARLSHALGVPLALLCRRMAFRHDPALAAGLVICDASGVPLLRRPVAGFAMPRIGAPCPLWPLFDALTAPGRPVRARVATPGPSPQRFEVWAAAESAHPCGLGGPALVEAVMLVLPSAEAAEGARGIGPGCRICPRPDCLARREPPLAGEWAPAPRLGRARSL